MPIQDIKLPKFIDDTAVLAVGNNAMKYQLILIINININARRKQWRIKTNKGTSVRVNLTNKRKLLTSRIE